MRVHYFQHHPAEGLGSMAEWLQEAGALVTASRFYESEELPATEEIDLLIVMGGPMSVNDEELYPWLTQEKEFIRGMVESGRSVLGVCLGAQLIASAMGARIHLNHCREIGWFPVTATTAAGEGLFRFPDEFMAFHWHGETFELPHSGVLLAESAGCSNQAFQLGSRVLGLQFHPEATPEVVAGFVTSTDGPIAPERYVSTEEQLLSPAPEHVAASRALTRELLSFLTRHL